MEHGWSRLAEWAADDRAVNGSRRRSLALASALVRVARMGASPSAPLTTSLLGSREDLAARVERLLEGETRAPGNRWWPAIAVALAIGIWAVRPGSLVAMHRALRRSRIDTGRRGLDELLKRAAGGRTRAAGGQRNNEHEGISGRIPAPPGPARGLARGPATPRARCAR